MITVRPPPGVSSSSKTAVHRLHEALGDRHAQTDTVGGSIVTELLEGCDHLVAEVRGDAGSAIDDADMDLGADHADGQTDGSPFAVAQRVDDDVLETSLEQRGVAIGRW